MDTGDTKIEGDVYGVVNHKGELHQNINKQEAQKDLDNEKLYGKWWFISLCAGFIMGIIIGLYFSILWGLISAIVTFLLIFMFNPNHRFRRAAWILVGLSGANLLSSFISGSLVIPENDIAYGIIEFGKEPYPWISAAFLVLAGFSFFYDSKRK